MLVLENLEALPLAYAAVVLFLAYLVRGIAGFGSGLIAVPLLVQVFPLQEVVPLVVFLDYVGSASQGLKKRPAPAQARLPSQWTAEPDLLPPPAG